MTLLRPAVPPRRFAPFLVVAALLAFLAVACGRPPGPSGWAAPLPLKLQNGSVVLVPHKSKLFALAQGSGAVRWQLPPESQNNYPVSERGRMQLTAFVDTTDIPDDQKASVKSAINNLVLAGDSGTAVKNAMKATDASSSDKDSFNSQVDSITSFEKKALSNIQALYGDLGVTSDLKTVFVPAFKGYIFALDPSTGYARWILNAGDELVGGIAVDGDTIYYGTKGDKLIAARAATGDTQWIAPTKGEVWATPTVSGDSVYATSLDGSVYAFDKASGNQRWIFSGADSGIGSQVTVANGTAYVGAFDNKLYSIDASDGSMNWSFSAGNWFWAAPVVQSGVAYAASLDHKVYAVDASSGAPKWQKPFDAGAPVRSTPVIAGGGLVVADRNGNVYKLGLDDGQSQGSVVVGTRVDANLTADSANVVYVSPTEAELAIIDASGSGPLPAPEVIGLP